MGILPHFFDAPMDRKAVPAEGCHLWHERQSVQAASLIERRENLRQTPHLDDFTRAQTRVGVQEPADCQRQRTSNSLARSSRKIWYSALFALVSNDDDQTADRHKGCNCSNRGQGDCRQAGQEPGSPFGQKMLASSPPKNIEDYSEQDDQAGGDEDRQDRGTNKATAVRAEVHWVSTPFSGFDGGEGCPPQLQLTFQYLSLHRMLPIPCASVEGSSETVSVNSKRKILSDGLHTHDMLALFAWDPLADLPL
jgi:hypothetical protein